MCHSHDAAGQWEAASDAEVFKPDPGEPPPAPHLVPRYSQRAPITPKAWPVIIQRALSAVQQDPALQEYDVIPGELSSQHQLIGWQQVLCDEEAKNTKKWDTHLKYLKHSKHPIQTFDLYRHI